MAPIRILVVDDNHLIRRLLELILEAAGYAPVEAESGDAALAIVEADPPDACIIDEAMPGMLGSELIRTLRRSRDLRLRKLPVIGISGRAGAARDLLAAGANVFVRKPIEEAPILLALARLVGSPRGEGAWEGVPA